MSLFAGVNALPAPDDPLCSQDDFVEWFGLAAPNTAQAARIQTALEISSAACRAETQQQLTQGVDTLTLQPLSDGQLVLPQWPVSAISLLAVDGQTMTDGTDYVWTDRGIVTPLTFRLCGWAFPRTVVVTYTHGWNPLPRDIAGACLSYAKRLYDTPDDEAIQSETLGAWSVTYAPKQSDGLTPAEKYTLSRYAAWTSGY